MCLLGLPEQHTIYWVLEPGSLRSKCGQGWCLVRMRLGLKMAIFSLCPHALFSVRVFLLSPCVLMSTSYRDTRHVVLGPTLMISF